MKNVNVYEGIDEGRVCDGNVGGNTLIHHMGAVSIVLTLIAIFVMSMVLDIAAHATTIVVNKTDRNVDEISIQFLDGSNGVYEWTGNQIKPSVGFIDANGSSVGQDSLSVTYGTNLEPGKGTITVTGLENNNSNLQYRWSGTKTFEFTITKANLTDIYAELNGDLHSGGDDGDFIKTINKMDPINNIKNKIYSSNNKNVFIVKKGKIFYKGVGVAYLILNVPETEHTLAKQFKFKITVKPQLIIGNIWSKKGKLNIYFEDGDMCSSKTNFNYGVEIYKNKSCKKKYLVKSKSLNGKKMAKGHIQTFKGLRKGKTYWVKIHAYKKVGSKIISSGYIKQKIKIK